MQGFFDFLQTGMICGTVMFIGFVALLALPQSRLRSVLVEAAKWGFAAILAFLVLSPIDFLPDVVPVVGWVDDLGYIAGAICAARSALNERRQRSLIEE